MAGCLSAAAGKTAPLTGDEVRQLAANKNTAEYETEPVPGARPEDLDQDILRDYLDRRGRRGAGQVTTTQRSAL
ncbi:MAG: hypothetical protein M5U34_12775 [Chloroflexi bacterium]|nr:hypothetical protein [Chloroflexota bacterium]